MTDEQMKRLANHLTYLEARAQDTDMTLDVDDLLANLANFVRPSLPQVANALRHGCMAIRAVVRVQREDVTSKLPKED